MEDENNRKKLIISVDDFGISETANKNILELLRLGKINRISVMPEGKISQEEIQELLRSGAKLDVHLELKNNFDEERKLKAGVFGRSLGFLFKLGIGVNGKKNVQKRWEGQIEKFKMLFGKYPDGINSHEHIHFFPAYFKIALELGKKYNISYIRMSRKTFQGNCLVSQILNYLRKADSKILASSGILTSDFLVSFDWAKGNVEEFIKKLPEETELIFHPERPEEYEIINKLF